MESLFPAALQVMIRLPHLLQGEQERKPVCVKPLASLRPGSALVANWLFPATLQVMVGLPRLLKNAGARKSVCVKPSASLGSALVVIWLWHSADGVRVVYAAQPSCSSPRMRHVPLVAACGRSAPEAHAEASAPLQKQGIVEIPAKGLAGCTGKC